jgi:enterochelin esterase-like enzyme
VALTSGTTLLVAVVLAVGSPLAALLTWNRVRGPRPVRAVQRLGLVALAQVCAVLVTFLVVNDQYVFFTSVQDLVGAPPPPPPLVATGGQSLTGPSGLVSVYPGTDQRSADGGRLLTETVHGQRSGITAQVLVHLPLEYARQPHRRFPVVELLAGWHDHPQTWMRGIHVVEDMRHLEEAGAFQPVILVIPTVDVALPRDAECTDVPHGPQAETWLGADVRDLVLSQFRALPGRDSWAVMGYSSGGYCAAKLALHHPGWYGTAAVLSGYFDAIRDSTTGDLWGGSQAYRNLNSPHWLLTHRPIPATSLLVFSSKHDGDSWPSTRQFLQVVRPPLQTFSIIEHRGGHNLKALRAALPEVLVWLSGHLNAQSSLPAQPPATTMTPTMPRADTPETRRP